MHLGEFFDRDGPMTRQVAHEEASLLCELEDLNLSHVNRVELPDKVEARAPGQGKGELLALPCRVAEGPERLVFVANVAPLEQREKELEHDTARGVVFAVAIDEQRHHQSVLGVREVHEEPGDLPLEVKPRLRVRLHLRRRVDEPARNGLDVAQKITLHAQTAHQRRPVCALRPESAPH